MVAVPNEIIYEDLVCEYEGHRFGKRILREAFSSVLRQEIAWRIKTPIEYGSGSTALKQLAQQSLSDAEFDRERERAAEHDLVKLRDKEQCFYYLMYRNLLPPPKELAGDIKTCADSGAGTAPGHEVLPNVRRLSDLRHPVVS